MSDTLAGMDINIPGARGGYGTKRRQGLTQGNLLTRVVSEDHGLC